jgi:hypothetical protein
MEVMMGCTCISVGSNNECIQNIEEEVATLKSEKDTVNIKLYFRVIDYQVDRTGSASYSKVDFGVELELYC